ncbi:MAG TPA: hypothetical protein VGF55_18145 [Gemmataceae bacterium]|jgi:hypothetical protein
MQPPKPTQHFDPIRPSSLRKRTPEEEAKEKRKAQRKWLVAGAAGIIVLGGLVYLLVKEPGAGSVQRSFARALAGTDGGFTDVAVRADHSGPTHVFEFTATVSDGGTGYVLRCDRTVGDNSSVVQVRAHHAADYDPKAPVRILGLTVDTDGDKVKEWANGNIAKKTEVEFLKPKAIQLAQAVRKALR